jgi:hypothetical protein
MRLPEIQHRLRRMALELNRLADDLSRQPARSLSPATIARVRVFKVLNPDASLLRIAERFHLKPEVVSEILKEIDQCPPS